LCSIGLIARWEGFLQKNALAFARAFPCKLFVIAAVVSLSEAFAAIHRTVARGFKGDSGFLAAIGADSSKHLACITAGSLTSIAASLTSLWLIHEASLSIEFLLASREDELIAALFALQSLVSVHGKLPHFDKNLPLGFLESAALRLLTMETLP